ncbi:hypothetical protein [Luteibacter sp. UNCMF366Tsu5.1]|uniref:hypothetical protein n=1 Tax=Luteibacter sp. UNCMF366Tsu5.1 TaxID=1502758 RepID=UPI0009089016|nr:hypothetical protein [Luteibacter sp. UNCMF366Tsu5.1]SFW71062.1 hypothetical protein SAMN02800691_3185 [Luteibacter sp. UNCMF366Tsu5.1]
MGSFKRLALPAFMMAIGAISPASYGTCWEYGAGPTAIYRKPTVAAEFKDAAAVITGRVTAARNISEPDDPEGYAWTIYSVQVLETFKGTPQRTIQLLSENTTARFPMDTGKTYLLFISQSSMIEMAGKERLPTNFIDICGNSAVEEDARSLIKEVRHLSKSQ